MGSGDKKTIAGVVVGLASGGVYMTGPLAFPAVPVEVWQGFFWLMVAILALSIVYFVLVHTIKEDRAMPIAFMVVGGIFFFAGAIWLGLVSERGQPRGAIAALPATSKGAPNFPYLRALIREDKAATERHLFVENAKSVPIQGVEIVFQNVDDPSVRHRFWAAILYQDGTWFVPAGDPHTLRIGAGQYVVTINSLDGAFTEYLSLKMDGGTLKQKIEVFKSLPRGQGGLEDLLLHEEE